MAMPDYFGRNAVAISQALSGLDEKRLEAELSEVCVGITIGPDASGYEGRALVDLLVRLLARLYPAITIRALQNTKLSEEASNLASRINPCIELSGAPTVEIVIGKTRIRRSAPQRIFAGADGWSGTISTIRSQACGDSNNPFGAGVAACLAAANLFRHIFLPEVGLNRDSKFLIPHADKISRSVNLNGDIGNMVLAGAGAIGNAAAWALARTPLNGSVVVVDHERVDLGNLQRYVLTERNDEGNQKAKFIAKKFSMGLSAKAYDRELAQFLQKQKHRVDRLLLALDSAQDRRTAQASLPCWIANAWTQPDDLGVSTHDFLGGACVYCLYLPNGTSKNEDEIITESFGVPDRLMQIRELLYKGEGAPKDLLEAIAAARDIPLDRILPFEGHQIRKLYTEGFCGGGVIPLSQAGEPTGDVHVPLAHQSALAGVLLAAAGVQNALYGPVGSFKTQYNVLKSYPNFQVMPVAKDPRGICICQDKDYREAYQKKYL
ncbi:MAG: E2 ligase fold family C protein [Gammaproteobacteria bacterium]|nr:E2 ligase fold family C protein [Gammaproteobacteria bacterium]